MQPKLLLIFAATLIMWTLKRDYADTPVDRLGWILGPTARVVTVLTGTVFERKGGEGYFSSERMFVIEKACAGINFMIAAFGMVAYVLGRRAASVASIGCVLGASAAASYIAAVLVNALRISFALWLAGHPVPIAGVTAAQAHRVEGIVFYFGGLLLLYEFIRCVDARGEFPRRAA